MWSLKLKLSSGHACIEWLHDRAANLYSLFGTDLLCIASYAAAASPISFFRRHTVLKIPNFFSQNSTFSLSAVRVFDAYMTMCNVKPLVSLQVLIDELQNKCPYKFHEKYIVLYQIFKMMCWILWRFHRRWIILAKSNFIKHIFVLFFSLSPLKTQIPMIICVIFIFPHCSRCSDNYMGNPAVEGDSCVPDSLGDCNVDGSLAWTGSNCLCKVRCSSYSLSLPF